HEVSQPSIGLPVHDAVPRSRGVADRGKVAAIDREIAELHRLLEEEVTPRNHDYLSCRQIVEEKDGVAVDRDDWMKALDFLAGYDGCRQIGLDRLNLDSGKRAAVDPDRSAIQRLFPLDGLKRHGVAVEAVHALGPIQPIAVVFAEAQLQRQRQ